MPPTDTPADETFAVDVVGIRLQLLEWLLENTYGPLTEHMTHDDAIQAIVNGAEDLTVFVLSPYENPA